MPSDCLSAPDLPSDDPGSSSPELLPEPEPEEEPDFLPVAPFALALEVALTLFFAVVFTLTFFALILRDSFDFVLSLNTEMVKEPPTPTLSPAAAAFAASCLKISLDAITSAVPEVINGVSPFPFPICARVSVPDTLSARTGVTEIPPAAPATASVVWVSVNFAQNVISGRALSPVVISVPSSTSAMVSIPDTETAMPAPTPAFSDLAAPLALAFVSSFTRLSAVTFSFPPER